MTEYTLDRLVIHPEWSQAWQIISSEILKNNLTNEGTLVQRLPTGLVPSSLIVRGKDQLPIRFVLLPEKKLDRLTNRMKVIVTDQKDTKLEGKILSVNHKTVELDSNKKYVKIFNPKSLVSFYNLELHPLVSLLGIQTNDQDLNLQYLIDSLTWEINYMMTLISDKEAKISIRAIIQNKSQSSFFCQEIVLMAGQSLSGNLTEILKYPGRIRSGEMYMNTDITYQTGYLKLYRHYFGDKTTDIIYRFDAPSQMTKGKVLIYQGSQETFIGSSRMPDRDKDQQVDLAIGNSSLEIISMIQSGRNITVEIEGRKYLGEEVTLTAQFSNPRNNVVPVSLLYRAPRRIYKSEPIYRQRIGLLYEWLVDFKPNKEKQMITIKIIQQSSKDNKQNSIRTSKQPSLSLVGSSNQSNLSYSPTTNESSMVSPLPTNLNLSPRGFS